MHAPKGNVPNVAIDGGVRAPWRHDSSEKHVSGEAIYVDDMREPPGTLQIFIGLSERAHAVVKRLELEKVRSQPSPVITFDGFGESALNFTMRYWGQLDDMARISSDVAIAVYQALRQAGIEIPVPQRDLRLREMPATSKPDMPADVGSEIASNDPRRTEHGAD